ncbi:P-loop ATPase, Sll1717 family [uncultured Xanthomonas sp.]|uniref:P-loop ATPase, Sll1717 family n=1 Tax=uncultured Xanthomonas sp. TaxID=152831 RepID=UPI0025F9ADF1|nr:hypothetical protein [uncultured Xanthomonas sp.]
MLLEEIRTGWKLDAKVDARRYFYHVSELARISSGEKCYVIGRKGTGKTAISKFIGEDNGHDTFSEKLSFKNFPFNELYGLGNSSYTRPNQYITIWKYIIYSNICKMMARNEAISGEIQSDIKRLYAPDPTNTVQRWIKRWTANDFSLSLLGFGAKVGMKDLKNEDGWLAKVDVLERVILKYADDSNYFVVFDELDEDYKGMNELAQFSSYTDLMTGLFKAVQDVKTVFSETGKKVNPVVFLRDDIYSVIMDPDKTKWDDFVIELEWDKAKMRLLMSHRISRSIDEVGTILPFPQAWSALFSSNTIGVSGRSKIPLFDYIARSTFLRPRDFVRFIHTCASLTSSDKISSSTVLKADKSFSNYLRNELIDEIHGVVPDIKAIFDVLSQIRKQTFSLQEFYRAFDAKKRDGSIGTQDANYVLKILFIFSVIGNQPRQVNQTVYRYQTADAEINFKENFVVHRGLFKSLQIV